MDLVLAGPGGDICIAGVEEPPMSSAEVLAFGWFKHHLLDHSCAKFPFPVIGPR